MVGATGAALVAMVARIAKAGDLAERADALRAELLEAGERDEVAYAAVIEAQAMPKADAAQGRVRTAAVQAALAAAASEPLRAAGLCLQTLHLASEALAAAGPGLSSDAACAGEFAAAALAACAYNVRVNHRYMKDDALVARGESALRAIEREAGERLSAIRSAATLADPRH